MTKPSFRRVSGNQVETNSPFHDRKDRCGARIEGKHPSLLRPQCCIESSRSEHTHIIHFLRSKGSTMGINDCQLAVPFMYVGNATVQKRAHIAR